ncbi:MAG: hypothetical protein Q8O35_09820 [Humidesulfovibrio sp.]|uniref:hypothetical protein n=1 Tax=Humidesulfovibrio sp. TaxID=2910988 RepID=UPI00273379C6|nr:hypothetical protein [Humidesulfovibrio sp.]MDP2848478.1 hypothetical protein [Humidesulfovibrio sp.]
MALQMVESAHPALGGLAAQPRFRFFELSDGREPYAVGALGEHQDCLELHLEVLRFGPSTVRAMRADMEELKRMARGRGKTRIVGLRIEDGQVPDPRWPKFTRLFGFTGQHVFQAAELHLG